MPGDSIFSDTTIWVGFSNFTRFFKDVQFWTLMKNTFLCPPIDIISITLTIGKIAGKSTCRILWKREAPSIIAASCCCGSTFDKAAI